MSFIGGEGVDGQNKVGAVQALMFDQAFTNIKVIKGRGGWKIQPVLPFHTNLHGSLDLI